MISKILKGSNLAGLFRYLVAQNDSAKRPRESVVDLGGSIPGTSLEEIAQHVAQLTSLRPLLSENAAHLILSWTDEDDPPIFVQQRMAQLHAEQLGFRHWKAISHGNHLHIGASRVNADGTVVSDSNDYRRGEESRANLERMFGLVHVPPSHLRDRTQTLHHVKAPSQSEMALSDAGIGSVRGQLQEVISAVLDDGFVTVPDFLRRLNAVGISVELNVSPTTNRVSGISFELDGIAMKGAALGRSFSWPSLQKRGLDYVVARDLECIKKFIRRREDGENSTSSRREHGKDQRDESGATADSEPAPARCGVPSDLVDRGEGDAGDHDKAAGNMYQQHRSSHEEGGRVADIFVQRHDAGLRPGSPCGELRPGNRSAAAATDLESGADRGCHFVDAADFDLPGHCSSNRKSPAPTAEGTSGDIEAFDGSETAEEALRKWSRNMAKQLRKSETEDCARLVGAPGIDLFSNLRKIAVLADVADDITTGQVVRQARGFGCDRFEIGVIPPKHRTDLYANRIRIFTLAQLGHPKIINWLKHMNLTDHDIFVRPAVRVDGLLEPFVFIDDLSQAAVHRLEQAGFSPAILIESSPQNYHAWVRVSGAPISGAVALHAARLLAADFGGDPAAVGSRQFGRLAGFTNRKGKYRTPDDQAPFARLHSLRRGIAPSGANLIARAESSVRQQSRKMMMDAQHRATVELGGEKYVHNAIELFLSKRNRCRITRSDGSIDESAADFAAAVAMVEDGWHVDAITNAIVLASPKVVERHSDVYRYANRTVSAAASSMRPRHPTRSLRPKR